MRRRIDPAATSLALVITATILATTASPLAAQRAQPVASPEVHADGTFTLRFRAPDAQQVTVIGELDGQTHPMTKDENGVWSVTLGPWAPDVYNYQFLVDGIVAMDPANPSVKLGFGGFPPANFVEIPADTLLFYDAKPVPHGSVRMETYHSQSLGVPRTLWVYTPPGYDEGDGAYPVFYLLHGSGNIDSSWILTGRANLILDNLIAEGLARPMILVMPFGYARQGVGIAPEIAGQTVAGGGNSTTLFARDLLEDVIPFIENKFRVLPGRENRALGGLSMGGGQTVAIGFANPDIFSWLVIMSAGATNAPQSYPEFFNAEVTDRMMDLIWVGIGEDDNLTGASARALHEALTEHGIEHVWRLTPGRHEWNVWRHHLREVAPLLFQD